MYLPMLFLGEKCKAKDNNTLINYKIICIKVNSEVYLDVICSILINYIFVICNSCTAHALFKIIKL